MTPSRNPGPDGIFTVAFRKDRHRRYRAVNAAFASLVGLDRCEDVIGRSTADFFPAQLVDRYDALDRAVSDGTTFIDRFDTTTDREGQPVWWLYSRSLDRHSGCVSGRSRRLPRFTGCERVYTRLSDTTDHIASWLEYPLRMADLADIAGCSASQLSRTFVRILGVPPSIYQSRLRIRRAKDLIARGVSFSEIALECGFADQSAFNHRFRRHEGMTPGDYRRRFEGLPAGHCSAPR